MTGGVEQNEAKTILQILCKTNLTKNQTDRKKTRRFLWRLILALAILKNEYNKHSKKSSIRTKYSH